MDGTSDIREEGEVDEEGAWLQSSFCQRSPQRGSWSLGSGAFPCHPPVYKSPHCCAVPPPLVSEVPTYPTSRRVPEGMLSEEGLSGGGGVPKAHRYPQVPIKWGDRLTPKTSRTQSPVSLCDPLLAVPPCLNHLNLKVSTLGPEGQPGPIKERLPRGQSLEKTGKWSPPRTRTQRVPFAAAICLLESPVPFLDPETLREPAPCGR